MEVTQHPLWTQTGYSLGVRNGFDLQGAVTDMNELVKEEKNSNSGRITSIQGYAITDAHTYTIHSQIQDNLKKKKESEADRSNW